MRTKSTKQVPKIKARKLTEKDKSIIKFMDETEGKRPKVNDPRATAVTKAVLSDKEVRLQAEAIKSLKRAVIFKNG